jgi:predicted extracellular nuclease
MLRPPGADVDDTRLVAGAARIVVGVGAIIVCCSGAAVATASAAGAIEPCGSPATPIHAIQGRGRSSPLAGQTDVSIEAVVVAAFPGLSEGLGGFFLQERDGAHDHDPESSEGIFVFDADLAAPLDLRLGDVVRVRGRVGELFGMTELSSLSGITRCPGAGIATPVSIGLPTPEVDASAPAFWERFEGMAVRLEGPLVLVDQYAAGRFGEVELAAFGRPRAATQQVPPGEAAVAWHAADERRLVLLDDGSARVDPDPWPYLLTEEGRPLRLGDRVPSLEGVLDFAYGRFRIQPTALPRFLAASPAPPPPPAPDGALRIVAWNVANLFNGDGHGGGFPTRGAASSPEYERQLAKIAATLAALGADVLALVEVENDGTGEESTLADLVAAVRALAPHLEYTVVDPAASLGAHPIAVALLHRADSIAAAGPPAVLDEHADAGFDSARNRPSLAQTFRHRASGARLTVVANHFKSKGSSCAAAGDPDAGDGQGHCNETRRRAARALADWLAHDPTTSGGAPVLIVGDLNAYPLEDPLAELAAAGFVDLIARFDSPEAHSFVFDGRAGRLDHALASPGLLPWVRDAVVWNVNTDESPALGFEERNPQALYRADPLRASDHDPVVVALRPVPEPDPLALAYAALLALQGLRRRRRKRLDVPRGPGGRLTHHDESDRLMT